MTTIDPTTLVPEQLTAMLGNWARGYYPDEAAIGLLIRGCGGVWLRRRDFLTACVKAVEDGWSPDGEQPMAAVLWENVPAFIDRGVPASSGEVNLLRAAASIAGSQVGSLREVTASLDADNLGAVLDAIAHRAGWHEHGRTRYVTGHLDEPDERPRAGAVDDPLQLPTFEQIRSQAYRELGDAENWLRSDARPGTGPGPSAVTAVSQCRSHIARAKSALDGAVRAEAGR